VRENPGRFGEYAYGYDLAGNRTGEQIGTGTNGPVALSQSSYNNVNQMTSRTGGSGLMQFAGVINKPATVTVGGNAAPVNQATTNFAGYASVALGTNVVPVIATDYSNNSKTNKYQMVVANNGVAKTISYDLNGNETSVVTATSTNTYPTMGCSQPDGIRNRADEPKPVHVRRLWPAGADC
jgi:hypothetical protein